MTTPTKEQQDVIDHKDGPALVLAGPGTGKTHVVVERVKKLVEQNVDEDEILCVTFTEKATEEMQNRLADMGNMDTKVSTFHSFCKEVCEDHLIESGIATDSKLFKETSLQVWCMQNSDRFGIDPNKIEMGKDNASLFKGIVQAISNFKESLITSSEFQTWLDAKSDEIDKMSGDERVNNAELIEYVKYHIEFNKVYAEYEKFQKDNGVYDFDDLIKRAIDLLKNNSLVLNSYTQKYKYILVDEFQDNNFGQYELVRLLGQNGNVMVVGDDNQLVMRFQGARQANFAEFKKQFANVQEYHITENFRSTKEIIGFANLFLENIDDRIDKENKTSRTGEKVQIVRPDKEDGQTEFIINTIRSLLGKEYVNKDGEKYKYGYGDFAILSRKRSDGRRFVNALKAYDVPSTFIGDYNIFDTAVISEVMLWIHIIHSPSTSGAYLYKLMTITGIDDINITRINEAADAAVRYVETGQVDKVFEKMKNCDSLQITQKAEVKEIVKKIEDAIKEYGNSTVAEMVSKIIYTDLSGLYKQCSIYDTTENRLNVMMLNKFYELALEFENLYPKKTFSEFQKYLRFMRYVEIDLEESATIADTVQVMTMHKSKGKEYPVVFITDIVQYLYPARDAPRQFYVRNGITKNQVSLNFTPGTRANDDRRLLYVASTRAENLLHIMAPANYPPSTTVRKVSKYLTEIEYNDPSHSDIIKIVPYKYEGLFAPRASEMYERIKTDIQQQIFGAVNKMDIPVALNRIIELARVKYFQEHRKDDPSCSGFKPEDVLKVDLKDLNMRVLEGKPRPLFDHSKFHVSKSSLQTDDTCPYKFKLHDIQKTPSTKPSIPLDFGGSIHKMIDTLMKEDPKKIPTKENAMQKLKEKLIFRAFQSSNEEQYHMTRGEAIIENYLKWRKNNKNEVLKTEMWIDFEFEGVKITGKVDWLEKNPNGEYEVVDFKTGKTAASQTKVEEGLELYIYARGIEKEKAYGKLPVKASLYFIEAGKQVTIDLDESKVKDVFDKKIKGLIQDIMAEKFDATPNSFECGRCDYLDICDAGKSVA